ncbi:hypothetical protein PSTG_01418 [Puccinia striiformis f. sp. tritici PST-78]|uniref:Myb-like domain-containing protein n=1 Tax=Puccinia striiformis f. sp. tritici PST-78 TaxID=1165861 RepID=A0A0L0W277_9BASI|nr:hypothetical protein PSTG_01418 [Puccinia striiformis f. sp. tritici PST-78]
MVNKQQSSRTSSRLKNNQTTSNPSSSAETTNHEQSTTAKKIQLGRSTEQTAASSNNNQTQVSNRPKNDSFNLASMKTLKAMIDAFIKFILRTNRDQRIQSIQEKRLAEDEQITWDAIFSISNEFITIDDDQELDSVQQEVILKHNLAHLFVMIIENSSKLIQQDFSPILESLLIYNLQHEKNLIDQSFRFIIELEGYRFHAWLKHLSVHAHSEVTLFNQSSQVQRTLTDYHLSTTCRKLIGQNEMKSFKKICTQIRREIMAKGTTPHLEGRFEAPHMIELCLNILREFQNQNSNHVPQINQKSTPILPTRRSPKPNSSVQKVIQLTISDGSDTSGDEGSDDFQDELLLEKVTPAGPAVAAAEPPQTPAQDDSGSTENAFNASNKSRKIKPVPQVLHDMTFEERHHISVASSIRDTAIVTKQLVGYLEKHPHLLPKVVPKNKTRVSSLGASSPRSSTASSTRQHSELPSRQSSKNTEGEEEEETGTGLPVENPITTTSTKSTFRFNEPQVDASKIQFESLPTQQGSAPIGQNNHTQQESNQSQEESQPIGQDTQESKESVQDGNMIPSRESSHDRALHNIIASSETQDSGKSTGESQSVIKSSTQESTEDSQDLTSSSLIASRLISNQTDQPGPPSGVVRSSDDLEQGDLQQQATQESTEDSRDLTSSSLNAPRLISNQTDHPGPSSGVVRSSDDPDQGSLQHQVTQESNQDSQTSDSSLPASKSIPDGTDELGPSSGVDHSSDDPHHQQHTQESLEDSQTLDFSLIASNLMSNEMDQLGASSGVDQLSEDLDQESIHQGVTQEESNEDSHNVVDSLVETSLQSTNQPVQENALSGPPDSHVESEHKENSSTNHTGEDGPDGPSGDQVSAAQVPRQSDLPSSSMSVTEPNTKAKDRPEVPDSHTREDPDQSASSQKELMVGTKRQSDLPPSSMSVTESTREEAKGGLKALDSHTQEDPDQSASPQKELLVGTKAPLESNLQPTQLNETKFTKSSKQVDESALVVSGNAQQELNQHKSLVHFDVPSDHPSEPDRPDKDQLADAAPLQSDLLHSTPNEKNHTGAPHDQVDTSGPWPGYDFPDEEPMMDVTQREAEMQDLDMPPPSTQEDPPGQRVYPSTQSSPVRQDVNISQDSPGSKQHNPARDSRPVASSSRAIFGRPTGFLNPSSPDSSEKSQKGPMPPAPPLRGTLAQTHQFSSSLKDQSPSKKKRKRTESEQRQTDSSENKNKASSSKKKLKTIKEKPKSSWKHKHLFTDSDESDSDNTRRETPEKKKKQKKKKESPPSSPPPQRKRKRKQEEQEEPEDEEDSDSSSSSSGSSTTFPEARAPPSRSRSKSNQPGQRTFWTDAEENLLIKEVKKFSKKNNCMAEIIKRHGPRGTISRTFAHRTGVNLKDKAVNLSTKWQREGTKMSSKVRAAFSRFPPKIQHKIKNESSGSEESPDAEDSGSDSDADSEEDGHPHQKQNNKSPSPSPPPGQRMYL